MCIHVNNYNYSYYWVRIKVHSYHFIPQVLGEYLRSKECRVHYLVPIYDMGNKECRAALCLPYNIYGEQIV